MDTENTQIFSQQTVLVGRMILFTVLSGVADAMGFIHSTRAWQDGTVHWDSLGKGGLFFAAGLITYWLGSHDLAVLGVAAPELHAGIWFAATVIGLAVFSGQILNWPVVDQAIAIGVVAGLSTLIVRVG